MNDATPDSGDEPSPRESESDAASADATETPNSQTPNSQTPNSQTQADMAADTDDAGPGWMPIIMACTVLLGILSFIGCGLTTWLLFQKRGELAIQTVRITLIPEIEQSLLEPDQKQATIEQLKEFAADIERGKHENWQAAGVMQRLVRLPILQWGEFAVLDGYIEKNLGDDAQDAKRQLQRLRRAVELDQATAVDVEDILKPVVVRDESALGRRLTDQLTEESVRDVVTGCPREHSPSIAVALDRPGFPGRWSVHSRYC